MKNDKKKHPNMLDMLKIYCKKQNDTIQARLNSDFDVKCATIQFYGNLSW
jgi:hypothetical protein